MSEPRTPADLRDDRAADRDDIADQRDITADGRDETADQRDLDATDLDAPGRTDLDRFADRFHGLSRQIIDHLTRIATTPVDPKDWPDLTPAALAHLDAHTAEQRRLAALDLQTVTALLDQLQAELSHLRNSRHAGTRDRRASAEDRRAAKGNRHDSGHDRTDSAGDRGQSVIEREQIDPRDLPPDDPEGHSTATSPAGTAQRLSESRDRINRNRRP
jgi:hypothetical protein